MKRKRLHIQLTERQQMIIGLVLVILVAISMLYCLGFASLALRQAWESGPLPWSGGGDYYLEEGTELSPILLVEPAGAGTGSP